MAIRFLLINNDRSGITDEQLEKIAAACEFQLLEHGRWVWYLRGDLMQRLQGLTVRCAHKVESLDDDWRVELDLSPDEAAKTIVGGFHRVRRSPSGRGAVPFAKIAARWPTGEQRTLDGIASTISHECLEAWANPLNMECIRTPAGVIAFELADPVGHNAYVVDGVALSNFVSPKWFDERIPMRRFDFMGHCTKPYEVRPGGFVGKRINGRWYQETAQGCELMDLKEWRRHQHESDEDVQKRWEAIADALLEARRRGGAPQDLINIALGAGGAK